MPRPNSKQNTAKVTLTYHSQPFLSNLYPQSSEKNRLIYMERIFMICSEIQRPTYRGEVLSTLIISAWLQRVKADALIFVTKMMW